MRRTEYPIHSDFRAWAHMNPPLNRAVLPAMQGLLRLLFDREKSTAEVTVERYTIPVGGGASIRALWYVPKGVEEPAPCLVDYHGGGYVLPAAPYHYALAREYALRARCKVLFPEYRLAPKHPFPTPPEDCFAAYAWVLDHADTLGVDPARTAVAGDSAGGALAAAVCLMAEERGRPMPRGQMLVYPVTGAEGAASRRKYTDTPMCNSRDMEKYGKYYLQDPSAGEHIWSAPIDAPSLAAMPPAYVETAEFDCLRDDGVLYAQRLEREGVPAELYNTEGTIHGFDIVQDSPIVRACVDRRIGFLQRVFEKGE